MLYHCLSPPVWVRNELLSSYRIRDHFESFHICKAVRKLEDDTKVTVRKWVKTVEDGYQVAAPLPFQMGAETFLDVKLTGCGLHVGRAAMVRRISGKVTPVVQRIMLWSCKIVLKTYL